MEEENIKLIKRKKNEVNAQNLYQYQKLKEAEFYFVPCNIEEKEEELYFYYKLKGLYSFGELNRKNRVLIYGLLCQLVEVLQKSPEYVFSFEPDNLYYDIQGRIHIMERDLQRAEENMEEATDSLKSLAAQFLQKKYRFEDYIKGGISLLGKQKSTSFLTETETLEEIYEAFYERQLKEKEKLEKEYVYMKKKGQRIRNIVLILSLVILASFVAFSGYFIMERYIPQKNALLAERAYQENDLVEVVEYLSDIPVERMDPHEKYLLSTAYIKGQIVDSFDDETKELLLSKLAYNSEEAVLDYWIYLGRRMSDEAIDIALRKSDNQLLLYAYIQKMDVVSENQELTGEEKESQLNDLREKITSLAETLGINYKE